MKGVAQTIFRIFSSRAVIPLVLAIFLLTYIGVAFASEEALITLMDLTRRSLLLQGLLALLPISAALRLAAEGALLLRRRRLFASGAGGEIPPGMFDETVVLPSAASLESLGERLSAAGYTVRCDAGFLSARRGVSIAPLRLLRLAATMLLFGGILLSITGRGTMKLPVIEGETLEWPPGRGDRVERITLRDVDGMLLNRDLSIELLSPEGRRSVMGIYPPARYHGSWFFPRYLGIAPLVRFSAADLPGEEEIHYLLAIYPPGKEDTAEIPASPYRLAISLVPAAEGDDSFISGRMSFAVRILKGDRQLHAGTVPLGGELRGGGCRVVFAGFRRYVATDLVRDHGVLPIWTAIVMVVLSLACWLPLRLLIPRREMLFLHNDGVVHAGSFAGGGRSRHAAVFHDALDFLAGERYD